MLIVSRKLNSGKAFHHLSINIIALHYSIFLDKRTQGDSSVIVLKNDTRYWNKHHEHCIVTNLGCIKKNSTHCFAHTFHFLYTFGALINLETRVLQLEQCQVQGSTEHTWVPDTAHASQRTNGRDVRIEPRSLLCPLSASPLQSDAEPSLWFRCLSE